MKSPTSWSTAATVIVLALAVSGAAPYRLRSAQNAQAPANPPMQIEDFESRAAGTVIATPDANVKFRLAGGGFVERTTDGGNSWNGQLVSPTAKILSGSAPSASVCWLVGRDAIIFVTENGADWKSVTPPAHLDFVKVEAKNGSTATVTAVNGKKFETSDRGKKWKPVS